MLLGVNLVDYWEYYNPKQFQKMVDAFSEKEERRRKEIDAINWQLGAYIRIAFNQPNDYPKQPFDSQDHTIMNDDDMEARLQAFTDNFKE